MLENSQDGAPQALSPSGSRLGLGAWRVSWRLVGLIVVLTLAVVGFGGARINAARNATISSHQAQQLASLANAVAGEHGLVSALQDEANVLAEYVASGRPTSASDLLLPQANQAITNLAAAQVESLANKLGTGYPQPVRAAVTAVYQQIQNLKSLRAESLTTQAPALNVVEGYSTCVNALLALDDQIAATGGDSQLSADVMALGALERAGNSAADERAILTAALTRGAWQPGETTVLSDASAQESAELAQFQSDVPDSELASYQATVTGEPVNIADGMLAQAVKDGPAGILPGNPEGSSFATAQVTWREDMTYKINQMREFEQNLLNSIQARGQALHSQATQTVTDDWIEMLAVLGAVLGLAVFAGWKSSPSRRIHWI